MPVVLRHHDQRIVRRPQALGFRRRHRLFQHRRLDVAPRAVELVQFPGQALGFVRVVGRQQLHAEIRPPDPAAGIDARPDDEARMEGAHQRGRVAVAGDLHQGADAGIPALRHDLQALSRQRPVEPGQRRDIANGAQRRQVEPLHQVRPRVILEQPARLGLAVERGHDDEDDAGGGEITLGRGAARPVGIDDGAALRRIFAHQVVVDDHDLQSDRCGIVERLVRHGAAVDRDDQVGAQRFQPVEGGIGRTVTFQDAVGDIDIEVAAHGAEPAHQLRRRGGAVDVVIGEYPDIGPGDKRVEHGGDGLVHVEERQGIGEQGLQGRANEILEPRGGNPPARDETAERLDDIGLGNTHQGQLLRQLSQGMVADAHGGDPFAPGPSGQRPGDAEIGRHIDARGVESVHRAPIAIQLCSATI